MEKSNLQNIKVEIDTTQATISEDKSEKLIAEVSKKTTLTLEESKVAVSIICQKGGTSKKAQGNISVTINGKKVDLNTIRQIIKDFGLNFTLRQYARTNATEIYNICEFYKVQGDLAKKISRNKPEISEDEKIWLSNFQMDNEDCPLNIRELLIENYQTQFPNKK